MSEALINSMVAMDGHTQEPIGDQYLTFSLHAEQYALSILSVQEIRGWEPVTRIPNSPPYVKGVVNIRGNIIPVFDLRLRFGLPETDYTKETVVIVVRGGEAGKERSIGLVVDAVSDVLVVHEDVINQTPDFGQGVPTECIQGLVADGEHMVILLNLENLMLLDASATADDVAKP